jgi:hypothetical protein
MTTNTTGIANLRCDAHLDTRHLGRYQALDTHHARIRRRQTLATARTTLAAEVTQKRSATLKTPSNRL